MMRIGLFVGLIKVLDSQWRCPPVPPYDAKQINVPNPDSEYEKVHLK